jgi:hypothetical protein
VWRDAGGMPGMHGMHGMHGMRGEQAQVGSALFIHYGAAR